MTIQDEYQGAALFEVLAPPRWQGPLVLASPHSGSYLPEDLLRLSSLPPHRLRRSEDAFVDELFAGCLDCGAPMLRALVSRAYVDLNREPYEIDPRMFKDGLPGFINAATPRVMSGLGTIPRIVAEGEDIYRCKLNVAEAMGRIEAVYRPFHRTLADLLKQAYAATGMAVLLDCHSMPDSAISPHQRSTGAIDVVIGDRFGTSAAPVLVDELESLFAKAGFSVRRNRPYAGGFITETYGNPRRNHHAIQVEINRSLYMDESTLQKTADYGVIEAAISRILKIFAGIVIDLSSAPQTQIAAE